MIGLGSRLLRLAGRHPAMRWRKLCIIGVAAHRPKGAVPLKEGWMLRVYVADDCPGSPTARQRADRLRARAPEIPIEIIDIGAPGVVVPPAVFGTPIYTWDGRIIFLGNPSDQELLERARSLHERSAT